MKRRLGAMLLVWLACAVGSGRTAAGDPHLPATAQAPVPPPLPQRTANCDSPTYATDMLVCDDDELRELDRQLVALYGRADDIPATRQGAWLESANAWFSRRSRCAFATDGRGCAVAAYRDRIAVLTAWLAAVRSHSQVGRRDVRCGKHPMQVERVEGLDGVSMLALIDPEKQTVAGIASGVRKESGWQTFLSYRSRGRGFILSPLDAHDIVCSVP